MFRAGSRVCAAHCVPQHLAELEDTSIELGWVLQCVNGDRTLADNGLVIARCVLALLVVLACAVIRRNRWQVYELVLAETLRTAHGHLAFQEVDSLVANHFLVANATGVDAGAHNAPADHLAIDVVDWNGPADDMEAAEQLFLRAVFGCVGMQTQVRQHLVLDANKEFVLVHSACTGAGQAAALVNWDELHVWRYFHRGSTDFIKRSALIFSVDDVLCRVESGWVEVVGSVILHLQPVTVLEVAIVLQALRMLKKDGLVQDAPGRGILIADMDPQWIGNLYQVRGALDSLAARLAAAKKARLDPDIIAKGRRAARGKDVKAMIEADVAFHGAIYHASGNPLIVETTDVHWAHLRRVMGAALQSAGQRESIWDEHEAIFNAIASGQVELAAELSERHAASARQNLLSRLGEVLGETSPANKRRAGWGLS